MATITQKVYDLRRQVEELERWIVSAECTKQPEPASAIWRRIREKVTAVELALRATRSAVQSRKRAAAKRCAHESFGSEDFRYEGHGPVTKVGQGRWRCRFCQGWTTVAPKATEARA